MKYPFLISSLLCALLSFQAFASVKTEQLVTDFTKFNTKFVKGENLVSKTVFTEEGHSVLEFKYTNCKQGNYHLEFWVCPAKHKDGTFEEFSIQVNNVPQKFKIKPTKADWQSFGLNEGQSVAFKSGENTIKVVSEGTAVPNIDFIEVSPINKPIKIKDSSYKEFRTKIAAEKSEQKLDLQSSSSISEEKTLYDFIAAKNVEFKYSFNKSYYLDKNEWFNIAIEGVDDYEAILYFFKDSDPVNYSWAAYPDDQGNASLDIKIEESGYYTILLKPLWNTYGGFCNVVINDDEYFDNVPVSGNSLIFGHTPNQEYNSFTYTYSGDPMIWIEEVTPSENSSGDTTRIESFNDDGDEDGDFDWGLNSRVRRKYNSKIQRSKIFLTSYSSSDPVGRCDLYLNCKTTDSYVLDYFKYLNSNDAITSSKATTDYNCISWSGGVTSYWEWPLSEDSQYYSYDELEAFDNFYYAHGLTRENADSSNALVALWAFVDASGNREYTHASIRNGDGKLHGYSWESKAGSLERIFHPKYALRGNNEDEGYGQIVEYYKIHVRTESSIQDIQTTNLPCPEIVEVNYDSEEQLKLKELINNIDKRTRQEFESLYAKFSDKVKGSIHSNPKFIIDCPEFKELMGYYSIHPECKFIVFDLLGGNELPAMLVFNNLENSDNRLNAIRETALKKSKAVDQKNIYYPIQSNMMINAKEYLKGVSAAVYKTNESTDCDFTVNIEGGQILLEYSGQISDSISVEIYDQYGNLIRTYNDILPESHNKYRISDIVTHCNGITILKISTPDKVFSKKINL